MEKFTFIDIQHVRRRDNTQADALAKLAAALSLPPDGIVEIRVEQRWLLPSVLEFFPSDYQVNVVTCTQVEVNDWRAPFIDYTFGGGNSLLRVAVHENISDNHQSKLRLQELDSLEGLRLQAQQNLELYRSRMSNAYNRMVKERVYKQGDLVLVIPRNFMSKQHSKGKFQPKWEGPYVIERVYEGGAYQLVDQDGKRPLPPISGRFLKKYYI
uniref:Uncharacterized protein n=1 Tax=Ananas comosus var. bracteatus TaxID=296719 RepID=A0A6V7Q3P9_ANACO|nr:unnamed protein product [Ananas comosus var. bracteatus]